MDEKNKGGTTVCQGKLLRLARMFRPYRDKPGMRELCRIAIKCAQERWVGD